MSQNIKDIKGISVTDLPDSITGTPIEEQETIINSSREDSIISIYTSDPTTWTRLKKMCINAPEKWKLLKIYSCHDYDYAVDVVCDQKCVSFRTGADREYTDEQRAAAAERLQAMRNLKGTKTSDDSEN